MRQKQIIIWRHIQTPRLVQKCLHGQYKDKGLDKADKENEQDRQTDGCLKQLGI